MGQPVIVPRAEHAISRRQIDPDALKVLYRLHQNDYVAYLVGGSVRDLLLGRRPKDFDIGTSAHPYQVKRLFRNCWIIGRRFRLAHVRFGTKTIEVATFRRQVVRRGARGARRAAAAPHGIPVDEHQPGHPDRLLHRDNTFGTPEEDAFRRDFTVNALFYDIGDVFDHRLHGRPRDLEARVIRCIGDPDERFQEDPVRMLRAVAMAARLDFSIDPPIDAAIAKHRGEIARSAPARLIEEFYKLLRAGAAERAFRMLAERRLLEPIAHRAAERRRRRAVAVAGGARRVPRRFEETPDTLTNAVLLGSLLVPLGHGRPGGARRQPGRERRRSRRRRSGCCRSRAATSNGCARSSGLQRRLIDMNLSPRARRALMHRGPFREALTWLEIHGGAPEVLEHWTRIHRSGRDVRGRDREPDEHRRRAAPATDGAAARPTIAAGTEARRDARTRNSRLSALPLELLHELDERVDAFFRERVVDRRAHAADRAVALEAVEPRRGRFLHERFSSSSVASRNVTFISDRLSFCAVPR